VRPRICDLVVTQTGARFNGRVMPCSVGRGGLGAKLGEGDQVTPLGIWRLKMVLYRPDRVVAPRCCLQTRAVWRDEIWSDDLKDSHYNKGLRARCHPFSHETMRRSDRLYDVVATTDFNYMPTRSGAGSAIFVHVWRNTRVPTSGCVAFSLNDLRFILGGWRPWSRVVISGR